MVKKEKEKKGDSKVGLMGLATNLLARSEVNADKTGLLMREVFDNKVNKKVFEKVYRLIVKIRNGKNELKKQIRKLNIEDKKMKDNMKPKTFLCPLIDCEGCRADPNASKSIYVGHSTCTKDVRPRWP